MTARDPRYVQRFARLPQVLARLERHPEGVPLDHLARAFDATPQEIREDLLAYYTADVLPGQVFGLVRREVIDFLSPDGDVTDPNRAEIVRVTDPRPTQELGVEYVDAADLALLYTAGRELQELEPDDDALDSALQVLRDTLLNDPDSSQSTALPRSDAVLTSLEAAVRERRRVRIAYSRAWEPGAYERVIEPYRLLSTRRGWEVDAGVPDDPHALRTFLVSHIRGAELLDETFVVPTDADERVSRSRATSMVRLRVPQHARWVLHRFAESVTVRVDNETSLEVDAQLLPPLRWRVGLMLVTAGDGAAVVAPRDLVDAGSQLARTLVDHHRRS